MEGTRLAESIYWLGLKEVVAGMGNEVEGELSHLFILFCSKQPFLFAQVSDQNTQGFNYWKSIHLGALILSQLTPQGAAPFPTSSRPFC